MINGENPYGKNTTWNRIAEIPMPLLETLRAAKHVVVLTGAGISVESGLSTFRTPQSGLWERFDAEDLATPAAFKSNPPSSGAGTSGAG